MQLIIFAGGLGTRISEESDYIPKPMVKIGKEPIIWHIMKYYSTFGVTDFIICGGYKIEIIKKYFHKFNYKNWNVKVIDTGKKSNTGERLRRVKNYINGTFFLTYGDGLSNVDIKSLIKFHQKNKSIVTLTSVKPIPHYGRLVLNGHKVSKFIEKDKNLENWINGGFFICEEKIFNFLKEQNTIFESDTLTKLAKIKQLVAYKHKDFWFCMDTLRDKRHLNKLWLSKKAPWKVW